MLDREGYVSIGNRKRKQGHRPERARLVFGKGLGIAKGQMRLHCAKLD